MAVSNVLIVTETGIQSGKRPVAEIVSACNVEVATKDKPTVAQLQHGVDFLCGSSLIRAVHHNAGIYLAAAPCQVRYTQTQTINSVGKCLRIQVSQRIFVISNFCGKILCCQHFPVFTMGGCDVQTVVCQLLLAYNGSQLGGTPDTDGGFAIVSRRKCASPLDTWRSGILAVTHLDMVDFAVAETVSIGDADIQFNDAGSLCNQFQTACIIQCNGLPAIGFCRLKSRTACLYRNIGYICITLSTNGGGDDLSRQYGRCRSKCQSNLRPYGCTVGDNAQGKYLAAAIATIIRFCTDQVIACLRRTGSPDQFSCRSIINRAFGKIVERDVQCLGLYCTVGIVKVDTPVIPVVLTV